MEPDLDSVRRELADIHHQLLDLHLMHTSTSAGDAGIDGTFTDGVNEAISAGIGIDEVEVRLKETIDQMRSSR